MTLAEPARPVTRARTISRRQLVAERAPRLLLPMAGEPERPKIRGECTEIRPCPWVGCRHHLYLDVDPRTGALVLNFPDKEPWELAETCVLDVAARAEREGGFTLEETGEYMNLTRERIRQLQGRAQLKLEPFAKKLK